MHYRHTIHLPRILMRARILLSPLLMTLAMASQAADIPQASPAVAATPAEAAKAAEANQPVAVVNGVAIPPFFAEILTQERMARGQSAEQISKEMIRNTLINSELLVQEAKRQGLDKSPQLQALIVYRNQEMLARAQLENHLRQHPLKEEDIKAEYDKAKEKAGGGEYRASHILVPTEKEAKDVIAQLGKKKAKFADLAKKYSKDSSAGNGGDLGWVDPSALVGEFAEAMAKLKKGEYTKAPVQTRFGWHVILLEDSRDLKIPTYDEAKERVAQQMLQQQIRAYLQELRAGAKVE